MHFLGRDQPSFGQVCRSCTRLAKFQRRSLFLVIVCVCFDICWWRVFFFEGCQCGDVQHFQTALLLASFFCSLPAESRFRASMSGITSVDTTKYEDGSRPVVALRQIFHAASVSEKDGLKLASVGLLTVDLFTNIAETADFFEKDDGIARRPGTF